MAESEKLSPYPCPICPERFDHLADKKHHVRQDHSDSKRKGKK